MTTEPTPAGWYPDPTGKSGEMYWDGQAWHQDQTGPIGSGLSPWPGTQNPSPGTQNPSPGTQNAVVHAQQPQGTYAYKTPLLYAFGGLFFPPLVLFLMGGSRTTCLWMMGLWVLFWLTVWFLGLGAIFTIALYIWSVVACHQEAVKQNQAHGFAS
jgi:hypothetical protein